MRTCKDVCCFTVHNRPVLHTLVLYLYRVDVCISVVQLGKMSKHVIPPKMLPKSHPILAYAGHLRRLPMSTLDACSIGITFTWAIDKPMVIDRIAFDVRPRT